VNSFSISHLITDKTIFTISISYKLSQNYFDKDIGSRATFADNKRGEVSTRYRRWLSETFTKCLVSFKFKEDENFNRRNILDISRIEI